MPQEREILQRLNHIFDHTGIHFVIRNGEFQTSTPLNDEQVDHLTSNMDLTNQVLANVDFVLNKWGRLVLQDMYPDLDALEANRDWLHVLITEGPQAAAKKPASTQWRGRGETQASAVL